MKKRTKIITALFALMALAVLPYLAALRFGTGKQLSELSRHYCSDGSGIYFLPNDDRFENEKKYLEGVDEETFTVLGHRFAKDKGNVYFEARRIEGADAATFRLVDKRFPMDKCNFFEIRDCFSKKMVAHPADMSNLKKVSNDSFIAGDSIYSFSGTEWTNNGEEYQPGYFEAAVRNDSTLQAIAEKEKAVKAVRDEANEYLDNAPTDWGYTIGILLVVFGPGLLAMLLIIVVFSLYFSDKFKKLPASGTERPRLKRLLSGKMLTLLPAVLWPLVATIAVLMLELIKSPVAKALVFAEMIVYPLFLLAVADYGEFVFRKTGNLRHAFLTLLAGFLLVAVYCAILSWVVF